MAMLAAPACTLDEEPAAFDEVVLDDPHDRAWEPTSPAGGQLVGPVQLETPSGTRTVYPELIDGALVIEGDIVIADDVTPADLHGGLRAAIHPKSGRRWKDGVVPYVFSDALSVPQERVERAMRHIENRTMVRFVPRNGHDDYIYITRSNDEGYSSSAVGRQGGKQRVRIWESHSAGTIAHELMHALGFWHEQSRKDRGTVVEYHPECVDDGKKHNFDIHNDALLVGPFDIDSIMMYGPSSASNGKCSPLTLLDGSSYSVKRRLSIEDTNAVNLIYSKGINSNESGDEIGRALAVGDFDADGYDDLAVGAPLENNFSIENGGSVYLFKGTAKGLTPWRTLTQKGSGLASNNPQDQFGASLAVGDFNGDGVDDLAVGVPGEDLDGQNAAGAVDVYLGGRDSGSSAPFDITPGLTPWQRVSQLTLGMAKNEAGDEFGKALGTGDFDGDGVDDLAIGVPQENVSGGARRGAVFVLLGGATGFTEAARVDPIGSGFESDDQFGFAITAGDLDGDGDDELVVGAPFGGAGDRGQVHIYNGSNFYGWQVIDQSGHEAAQNGARFGFALASEDFDGDGFDDVAVGAPGVDDHAGAVFTFSGGGNFFALVTPSRTLRASDLGNGDHAGARLGEALAVGNYQGDARPDLAIGAPRADHWNTTRAGLVYLAAGTSIGAKLVQVVSETDKISTSWPPVPVGDPETDDRFGHALAFGDFNQLGRDMLAVGIPKESLADGNRVGKITLASWVRNIYLDTYRVEPFRELTQETTNWVVD